MTESEVVTKDSLIDDLRRTIQTTDRIAYHINFWAASIFGIFNFYEKDFPGDTKHNEIKAELAKMVSEYRPLFDPVYTSSSSRDTGPMTPSEKMMICCGFESQKYDPDAYRPHPGEMQANTSEIHRDHFKELIAKGKELVVKMSRNESFTSFMRGKTATRYWSPVFNYAMFGMSVQEHQTVGERFIELMGHFFITDEEQGVANFGNYEVMTELKIKHTLAALGIEDYDERIVKKIRHGGRRSLRRKKRKSTKRGSSLRRKKRKSAKRRKS
jgi:hypothetical protein